MATGRGRPGASRSPLAGDSLVVPHSHSFATHASVPIATVAAMTDDLPALPDEPLDDAVQLISDGDGLAVIGSSTAVERFLVSQGLDRSPSKDIRKELRSALKVGSISLQKASEIATESGRWLPLTAESASKLGGDFSKLMSGGKSNPGALHAMIGKPGEIKSWLQVDASLLTQAANPALLAGVGGIMAQAAMQQAMEEITDYLKTIDEKVDDILRAQKDAVLADMIGVDLIIEEAMTIRETVGKVSEVTWSKVQGTAMTIARTQAYALRQLDALADTIERKADVGELAGVARGAEGKVQEWLAVLARCFQLQDGIAILELDRVLDASPEELNQHRVALKLARRNRLELFARSTIQLLERMKTAADRANTKVLLHPFASPAIVQSNNVVATDVVEFQNRLGITREREALQAREWAAAAGDAWNSALKAGTQGLDAAGRFGGEALTAFRSVDLDGDGVPEKPRVRSAVEDAGAAVAGAASAAAGATAEAAAEAASTIGSWFRRKPGKTPTEADPNLDPDQD